MWTQLREDKNSKMKLLFLFENTNSLNKKKLIFIENVKIYTKPDNPYHQTVNSFIYFLNIIIKLQSIQ